MHQNLSPDEIKQLILLLNSNRYIEAEKRALALLSLYPGSGDVWNLLAISLQKQGKNFLHAYQKSAQLLPNDAMAQFTHKSEIKSTILEPNVTA